MTLKEAVKELNDRIKLAEYVDSDYIDCVSVDAVKMAISALSVPETNAGDTISRQSASDEIDRYYKDKKYITRSRTMLSAICQDMKNIMGSLPSAQPERKTGRWIETDDGWDGTYYVCSECGCPWTLIDGTPEDNNMHYCPKCGAAMVEDKQ